MEKALIFELENRIAELNKNIFPTNAPEGYKKPCLVYYRDGTNDGKTLDGFISNSDLTLMFSIMDISYENMKNITNKVENLLKSLLRTEIGQTKRYFVEDLEILDIKETWEPLLKTNRGIIYFKIYLRESED